MEQFPQPLRARGRFGGAHAERRERIKLTINNAFDEQYLQEVIPAPEFGGSFIHPGTERRVGVEATLKF